MEQGKFDVTAGTRRSRRSHLITSRSGSLSRHNFSGLPAHLTMARSYPYAL